MQIDLVDVFGSGPLSGNPLAVVHGGEGLDEAAMLRLTQWLGYSETTFLVPATNPRADYAVRIFYPAGELPFAGHPTLGSAFAWKAAGGVPGTPGRIVQQCGIGLVELQDRGDTLAFAAPPLLRSGPMSAAERDEAVRVTGVDPEAVLAAVHVANGPNWQLLLLRSAEDVLSAAPQPRAPAGSDFGLAGPAAPGGGFDWEVRAFFADQHGALAEDPVTGSFNAGLALHLFDAGLVAGDGYVAAQGRKTGAAGRIEVTRDGEGRTWIGGTCTMVARGAALVAGSLPS